MTSRTVRVSRNCFWRRRVRESLALSRFECQAPSGVGVGLRPAPLPSHGEDGFETRPYRATRDVVEMSQGTAVVDRCAARTTRKSQMKVAIPNRSTTANMANGPHCARTAWADGL